MSLDVLGHLQTAHEELICALDANDIEAIEERLKQLQAAIANVRSAGGWRDCAELKERAQRIAKLGEAARIRVNFLTDMTMQRLQMLAAVRGEALAGIGDAYPRPLRPVG